LVRINSRFPPDLPGPCHSVVVMKDYQTGMRPVAVCPVHATLTDERRADSRNAVECTQDATGDAAVTSMSA
jgi:hypothetical protein